MKLVGEVLALLDEFIVQAAPRSACISMKHLPLIDVLLMPLAMDTFLESAVC